MKYEVIRPLHTYINLGDKDEIWFNRTYLAVSMTVALVVGSVMGMLLALLIVL